MVSYYRNVKIPYLGFKLNNLVYSESNKTYKNSRERRAIQKLQTWFYKLSLCRSNQLGLSWSKLNTWIIKQADYIHGNNSLQEILTIPSKKVIR